MSIMVHDDLSAAADHITAIAEVEMANRRLALRCVMELAEQCAPGASVSAEALAGLLALTLGED